MPHNNTPSARNLRSNSQTDLTLSNIKALVDASKDEIITSLRAEMQSLRESISSLTSRVDKLEEENRTQREALKRQTGEPFSFEGACSDLMNELQQRERRKLNVVVFGASEATAGTIAERKAADKVQCSEIFEAIGLPNCILKDVSRIGSLKAGGRRLLRVSLENESDKHFLLTHSKQLRHVSRFNSVYVKPDLTHVQRKHDFELRKELQAKKTAHPDKDLIIYRGKIMERNSIPGFRKGF